MDNFAKYPVAVLALSFFVMWLSARIGLLFRSRKPNLAEDARQDLDLIVAGALSLLGLIMGFTSRWPSADTTSEKPTRRQRPTRLVLNTSVRIVVCRRGGESACITEGIMSTNVFCSMEPVTKASFSGSMLALPNCRVNCGLQSDWGQLRQNEHPFSLWPFKVWTMC